MVMMADQQQLGVFWQTQHTTNFKIINLGLTETIYRPEHFCQPHSYAFDKSKTEKEQLMKNKTKGGFMNGYYLRAVEYNDVKQKDLNK